MNLVFVTNNKHKFEEIKNKIGTPLHLYSLYDIGFHDAIPETHETIEENAIEKAMFIYNRYKMDCFADDTGLEIDALNGEPGVYSARYAGTNCTFDDNMNKVLAKMKGIDNRTARFRTVIALIEKGKVISFEGIIEGEILINKYGKKGFGYDPIFKPRGYENSFAEMTLNKKNRISHRAIAVEKLIIYLKNKY